MQFGNEATSSLTASSTRPCWFTASMHSLTDFSGICRPAQSCEQVFGDQPRGRHLALAHSASSPRF